jgi:hypothetical protein
MSRFKSFAGMFQHFQVNLYDYAVLTLNRAFKVGHKKALSVIEANKNRSFSGNIRCAGSGTRGDTELRLKPGLRILTYPLSFELLNSDYLNLLIVLDGHQSFSIQNQEDPQDTDPFFTVDRSKMWHQANSGYQPLLTEVKGKISLLKYTLTYSGGSYRLYKVIVVYRTYLSNNYRSVVVTKFTHHS